jgi:peptidoglycan hydrolase-like protein with peptidoglycan-binding domain
MSDGDVMPVTATGALPPSGVAEPDDEDGAGNEVEVLPRLRWSSGQRWAGSPERRSRMLPVLLGIAVALGVAAGFVARGFVSPAQVAANAGAPQPSLITQPVRYGVLPVIVSMRANVANGRAVAVNAPGDLGSSIAVVTSVGVRLGQRVGQGQLLFTVDQRPVFVFAGAIPAWRAMALGTHGPDVKQLQAGLAAAGLSTGGDAVGTYGPGTAAAVAALYRAHGLSPARSGSVQPAPTASPAPGHHHARVATAEVPLGEVVFLPRLPARVRSVDRLGTNVASGKPVAELGSGKVTLTGLTSPAQASQLQAGMKATAISDFSGKRFPVRVASVSGQKVVFVPAGTLPPGMAGQNVQVTLITSRVKSFIVPVAAVSTSGAGQTYVTVVTGHGQTAQVPVRLGLSQGGEQAVTPIRAGSLRPGELVVLGISAPSGKRGRPGGPAKPGLRVRTIGTG